MKAIFLVIVLLLVPPLFLFAQNKDEVIALLHEIDEQSTRFDSRITFIEKFNFGIPGGKNWLVAWEEATVVGRRMLTIIYVVDVDTREIKFQHSMGPIRIEWFYLYLSQYFKNLPGRTIWGNQIGDFNGEGFDMILTFRIGGMGSFFSISGFDPQTGKIRTVIDPFDFSFDERDENPPVKFVTYRGMQGFIFRYFDPPQVAGGPTWIPDPPNPRAGRWFFHIWDREQFAFVEIGEVDEAYIEGDWRLGESPVIELIQEENGTTAYQSGAGTGEEAMPIAEVTPATAQQPLPIAQSGFIPNSFPQWAWFAIIGGAVLIGGIALSAIRRKKQ